MPKGERNWRPGRRHTKMDNRHRCTKRPTANRSAVSTNDAVSTISTALTASATPATSTALATCAVLTAPQILRTSGILHLAIPTMMASWFDAWSGTARIPLADMTDPMRCFATYNARETARLRMDTTWMSQHHRRAMGSVHKGTLGGCQYCPQCTRC